MVWIESLSILIKCCNFGFGCPQLLMFYVFNVLVLCHTMLRLDNIVFQLNSRNSGTKLLDLKSHCYHLIAV